MRKNRRFSAVPAFGFAAALVAGMTGCGGSSTPPPKQSADQKPAAATAPAEPTVAELEASLHDPEMSVRLHATEQLGPRASSSPAAVAALVTALKDKDPLVRRFAAYGVANAKSPTSAQLRALAALLSDAETDPRESASRGFVTLAPRVPDDALGDIAAALAAAVPDTQEQVRVNVLEALGALGPRAARSVPSVRPAVERALSDSSEMTRSAAVAAAGSWGAGVPGTVNLLAKALADQSHEVRKQAVVALEKIGPDAAPATKAITRLLKGKEIYLRVFAADALTAIGPGAKAALPELKALAKRGYKDIQNSPEMEAKQLPEAVTRAIESIEGKAKANAKPKA